MASNQKSTSSSNQKSERQKRHERVSANFSINLTVDKMAGIILAVLGTFILFFDGTTSLTTMLIRIIGVIAACLGIIAVVNYFRYKNSGKSLIIGIVEIVVGVAITIAAQQISLWIFLALGIILALYGIYLLITSKGRTLDVIVAIVYIVVGILIILYMLGTQYDWEWITSWGKYPIGIIAYLGAILFLFM